MCIRSKHDAITAWCATVKKVRSNQTPLPTQRHNQSRHSEASAFTLKPRLTASTISISVYRCIAFCLLIATHNSTLITGVSSVEIAQQNMVVNSHGINDFSTHSTPLFKHPYRRRFKRAAIQRPERHLWSPDLVTFVCDELADPCTRAAFLRRHAFHEICSDVPPLYLLPHIADAIEGSNQSSTRLCVSTDKGIRNTDGLFRNYLETPSKCRKSMEALDAKIRSSVTTDLDMFVDILERSFCTLGNDTKGGVLDDCAQCQKAYRSWVCTTTFPIFYPLATLPLLQDEDKVSPRHASTANTTSSAPSSITTTTPPHRFPNSTDTKLYRTPPPPRLKAAATFRLERVPACVTWCIRVETLCPYYNPADSTSNGGEPTFLCDESHYDYAPQDNPHSVSRNTGCEYGCCFTEQDLLIDVLSDESTPPTSTSAAVTSNQGTSVALGQEEAKEEEEEEEEEEDYFSLAARCLHQHLSDSLGDAPSSHTSHSPRRSSTSAATASLRHTAFLSAITATVVGLLD